MKQVLSFKRIFSSIFCQLKIKSLNKIEQKNLAAVVNIKTIIDYKINRRELMINCCLFKKRVLLNRKKWPNMSIIRRPRLGIKS